MPIYQQGALNTTALIVPDLYIQILPPNVVTLNGVPTNVIGGVGAASWGPVNQPTVVGGGNMSQFAAIFGPVIARLYDLGTFVALAVLQGAQAFRLVRVTDGTDTAASYALTGTDNTMQITVAGTPKGGDILKLAITPSGGSEIDVSYTMTGTDTAQTGAAGLAAAVNANVALQAAGISADTPTGGVFKLHWGGSAPTVTATVGGSSPTDTLTAASAGTTPSVNQITFTSIWTGSYGNNEIVNITNGSAVGTWRVVISMPGQTPETFDNLGAGVKGNALWQAIASAINNGVSGIRGPSQLLRATAGQGAVAPTATQYTLTGGTDGYNGITSATMIGTDTAPRTGMYALRNQGVSIGSLADVTDLTTWAAQEAFGLFEGIYMITAGPPGDAISNATGPSGSKATAGIDTYALKCCFGDWLYWFDTVNNLQRLVSPQGVYAGLLANLSPENSSLNKQVYGIVGTQKSLTGQTYSTADLQALISAGWDVIANPIPAGPKFGSRIGHNASSSSVIHGDNYTRMTNYIAATLNAGMGQFVGKPQSRRPTDALRSNVKATLDAQMQAMLDAGMIDDFQNVCDQSNNTSTTIGQGYLIATCQVVYLGIVEFFIVNLQGGQTVTINRVSTAPAPGTFAATPSASTVSAVSP